MEFQELPNELLVRIASLLDAESLISFGRTNSRMEAVSLDALRQVTVKKPNEAVLVYLRVNGHLVRSMDLSHCRITFIRLLKCVADCRHLKALNLVNTTVPHSELLCILRLLPELETLSFTMKDSDSHNDLVFEDLGPFKSIKKLYVEMGSKYTACKVLVGFLNQCETIEMIHVFFVGDYDPDRVAFVPPLAADRWETLHTFVCSLWLSGIENRAHHLLLRSIFTHKPSREFNRWIEERKDIYIYERGFFNLSSSRGALTPEMLGEVEILRKYQTVKMSEGGEQTLRTPWGLPWSLRINGVENWASELNKMNLLGILSSQLRELDLRDIHDGFSEEFRLAIITSSPNLSVLALPVCFFASSIANGGNAAQEENRARNLTTLTKAMQKLKTFTLSGKAGEEHCSACCMLLTSNNVVRFNDLKELEELYFTSDISFDASVWEHIGSRKLRAMALPALWETPLSGLRSSLRRSPNLKYLKLNGYYSGLHTAYITKTLEKMKNLRQVCLSPIDLEPGPMEGFLQRLPQNLEVLHIHWNDPEDPLEDPLDLAVRDLAAARGKEILYEDSIDSMDPERSLGMPQFVCGRALCFELVPIGYVKPVGWNVE